MTIEWMKKRGPAVTLAPVHKAPTHHKEGLPIQSYVAVVDTESLLVGVVLLL
jgi:hypothetical protein